MKDSPLVSVIMIFLNEEQFIEEAVRSVFQQTLKDWELLLVDDGSTDTSTRLAQRYAAENPSRVRYLEHQGHQNRGMSASRNLGVGHARGDSIAILDADDIWLPEKLERQVATFEERPEAEMLFGPTEYWFSWARGPHTEELDEVPDPVYPPPQPGSSSVLAHSFNQRLSPRTLQHPAAALTYRQGGRLGRILPGPV